MGALGTLVFLRGLRSGSAAYWQSPMLQVGLEGAIFTHSSPLFVCGDYNEVYPAWSTFKKHILKIAFWEEEGYLDHCTVVEVTPPPP